MISRCYRCGDAGHWAEACPHNERAANRADHLDRIAGYAAKCAAGQITAFDKRRMIEAENKLWYGDDLPPSLRSITK